MAIQGVPINRTKLLEQIKRHGGNATKVCKAMGMSTKTFYVYRDQDPEVAQAIDEARDMAAIDQEIEEDEIFEMAKQRLKELIAEGDVTIIIYVMKSLGRKFNQNWSQTRQPSQLITDEDCEVMDTSRDPLSNGPLTLEHQPKESSA